MSRPLAAAAAMLALSVTPAVAHPPGVCVPTERCETWSATYDDPAVPADRRSDQYAQVVLANDTTVFTAVRSVAFSTTQPILSTATGNVVAYDRATGAVRWTDRQEHGAFYSPEHAVLSPDGGTLYVSGNAYDTHPFGSANVSIVTTAYAAGTGAVLWSATRGSTPDAKVNVNGIAVAPDGSEVYVVGTSSSSVRGHDFLTVAYGATGTELWSRTVGELGESDEAMDVAVSADGSVLAVTGWSGGVRRLSVAARVAYSLRGGGGRQLWAAGFDGLDGSDGATAVAAGGDRFYVTGSSKGPAGHQYATFAYDVRTGARQWVARWSNGPGEFDVAYDIAVANGRVVVTGRATAESADETFDAVTIGYDAATGRELWVARFAPAQQDGYPAGLAMSRDGATAYVVTREDPYVHVPLMPRLGLVAYDVATGAERWHTFLDSAGGSVGAADVAVGGGSVAVAGDIASATTEGYDALTAVFPG